MEKLRYLNGEYNGVTLTSFYQLQGALESPHSTDRWEVFQDGSVFLLAVRIFPVRIIEERVEGLQHRNLDIIRNRHVVFHGVQSSEHEVKDAHSMPERDKLVSTRWANYKFGVTKCRKQNKFICTRKSLRYQKNYVNMLTHNI